MTPRRNTRSNDCPFFGGATPLPTSTLPSKADVLRYYQFIRTLLKIESGKDNENLISDIVDIIAQDLEMIWTNANVIPKCLREIKLKVRDLYDGKGAKRCKDHYKKMKNWYTRNLANIDSEKNHQKYTEYKDKSNSLFDIAKCNDPKKEGPNCDCKTCELMLAEDKMFLFSLRQGQFGKIGSQKDVHGTEELAEIEEETSQLKKAILEITKRKIEDEKEKSKRLKQSIEVYRQFEQECENEQIEATDDPNDHEYQPRPSKTVSQRNDMKIRNFIIASIFGNVSTATCAYQATGLFIDADQITDTNKRLVFTISKIRDWKTRLRRAFIKDHITRLQNLISLGTPLICLSFDSKKERQLRKSFNQNGRLSRSLELEEHYTILEHQFGKFITSITVNKPNKELEKDEKDRMVSELTEEQIMNFFIDNNISLDHVRAAACDGTNSNTGWENGIIRRMEQRLRRPLQWIICVIHLVEITLKNLLIALLGPKKVKGFSGHPLGTEITLENLHLREVVDFETISVEDFPVYRKEDRSSKLCLTSDQDILYMLCLAVIHGNEEYIDAVKHCKLGQIGHARWLTTAIRILRIYISESNPSEELKILAKFIVNVYSFVYFDCKKNSSFIFGAKHYFNLFNRSSGLPRKAFNSVTKTLTTNSYWAHPENVLISMLGDKDASTRSEACRLIEKARINNEIRLENLIANPILKGPKKDIKIANSEVRYFIKPTPDNEFKLDFSASHFSKMVDLENNCFEPPLTIGVTNLNSFEMPNLKGDTQATERFVQMVNKSCGDVTEDVLRNANVLIKEHFLNNIEKYQR